MEPPRAMHPEGVDRQQALRAARVVEGVGVEQHLQLAVQALPGLRGLHLRAVLAAGLRLVLQPASHIVALGPLQRRCDQVRQRIAPCQPARGLLVHQGDAIALQPGGHDGQQGARGGFVQRQFVRVDQRDVVGAHLPVAGSDKGPGARVCGLRGWVFWRRPLPLHLPGRPGRVCAITGQAQGAGQCAFVRHGGMVFVAAVAALALQLAQQPVEVGQGQGLQRVLAAGVVAGGVGNQQVERVGHGALLSRMA